MNIIADDNYLIITSDYTINAQGLIISFYLIIDYDEIVNLVELSEKMLEFIMFKFETFFKKHNFVPKFNSPIVISEGEKLKLVMCYVGKPTDKLKKDIKNLNIEENNYV